MLLGLPVGEGLLVACPECGIKTRVDEALGELTVDGSGRTRFSPQRGAVDDVEVFWTAARRRVAKRFTWRALSVGAVTLSVIWATFELALVSQAVAARMDTDWSGRLRTLHTPQGGKGSQEERTWEEIAGVVQRYEQIEQQSAEEVAGERASGLIRWRTPMYFREPLRPLAVDASDFRLEQRRIELQAREISRRAIRAASGVKAFSGLDDCEWGETAPGLIMPPGGSPWDMMPDDGWKQLSKLREIARARMVSAIECGEVEEFEAAFVLNGRLAAAYRRCPTMITFLGGCRAEDAALELCIEELAGSRRMEFVVAMDRLVLGMATAWHVEALLEAEHAWQMACLQTLFSSPDRVRWGTQSKAIKKLYSSSGPSEWKIPGRLGWYWENREALQVKHDEAVAEFGNEQWERTSGGVSKSELFLLNLWAGGDRGFGQWRDQSRMLRRTAVVMLALERFRIEHGDYPRAISEIEGNVGVDDMHDPYSGQTFRYVRLDDPVRVRLSGTENRKRVIGGKPYLLYAVGGDAKNDFGATTSLDVFYPALGNTGSGLGVPVDLLLNATIEDWANASEQ